ncbi:uncharacterized protein LOC130663925 [Microplitis mediator]|uniref:uncharacterized protein LOC130663925 n=1 Tax=Microplitis mediator TaxID=375433 RepID=UPI002555615D|nr:uncharacterized protein LOC130663925 [Microplitis mediator]
MTASKFSSNKSQAEPPLSRHQKYREKIFDTINSIKIFQNNPSLSNLTVNFLYYTIILVRLIILIPLVVALSLAFCTIFIIAGIASKGTFLWMTSQLERKHVQMCVGEEFYNSEYIVLQPEEERIMWIWCLIIAYTLSELISSFICFKKAKNKPSLRQLLSVIIPETFHTIGISLIIFEVLPKLSRSNFELISIWCFIEVVLRTSLWTIYKIKNIKLKSLLVVADIVTLGIIIIPAIFFEFRKNRNNSGRWITILALALIHGGLWQDVPKNIFSFTGNLPPIENARSKLKPVKDSIFAWVSLWKIIVFFASSLTIFAMNRSNTTQLFTMFGPAFSSHNVTLIPSDIDFKSVLISKSLLLPFLMVSFQVILSIIINMKPNIMTLRIFSGFDFRSFWGMNINIFIQGAFTALSQYSGFLNCNLIYYRVPDSEQLTYFVRAITESWELPEVCPLKPSKNLFTLLLQISFVWIMVNFILRSGVYSELLKRKKPETKTPQEVEDHSVSKNETVEEKEKLEC